MLVPITLLATLLFLDPSQTPSQAPPDGLRVRVEALHNAPPTAPPPIVRGERLRRPDAVAHFYEARAFEPAWTNADAARQILRAIRDIEADGLTPAHYHLATLETLLEPKTGAPASVHDVDVQLLVTDAVALLVDDVRFGRVRPVTLDRRWNVDTRAGAPPLETLVQQVATSPAPHAAIEALKPSHFIYKGLKTALARFRSAGPSWPTIAAGPSLKPGMTHARVEAMRKRLVASGELPPEAAGGEHYDAAVEAAVKRFQERHRLTADGVAGRTTIEAMNVNPATRANQIRANLERARWVVSGLDDSFVLVNLPAFKVYLIRDRKNIWESRTMIGKAARQTPTFRADMKYLVFNPDWTVPPTILAKDVLAGMRRGENTIARKKLAIIDRQGRRVDPDTIDWSSARPGNFPYTLRQAPGEDNALGRVKFIFPNEHAIFLHDTPSRELFSADQRTFSSGCIRVENPLDLAAVLLEGHDDWKREKIDTVVAGGKTETVFLHKPLPVLIVYWTVSVGATGDVRYARDVYNRDPAVLRALDVN